MTHTTSLLFSKLTGCHPPLPVLNNIFSFTNPDVELVSFGVQPKEEKLFHDFWLD
eukprot:UN04689